MSLNKPYSHIIVDSHNLYLRCYARFMKKQKTIGDVDYKTNNAIKESLLEIDKIKGNFGHPNTHIYFLFDNPESKINYRKKLYPQYKHIREKKYIQNLYKQLNLFKYILEVSDNQYYTCFASGMEADDIVPHTITAIEQVSKLNNILLVSSDMDWARCLKQDVDWYNFTNVIDTEAFYHKFKFRVEKYNVQIYKAIRGDASDNIKAGVSHMPSDVLYKILATIDGKIDKLFEEAYLKSLGITDNLKKKILQEKSKVMLNYQMVDFLDYTGDINDELVQGEFKQSEKFLYYSAIGMPAHHLQPDKYNTFDHNFFSI